MAVTAFVNGFKATAAADVGTTATVKVKHLIWNGTIIGASNLILKNAKGNVLIDILGSGTVTGPVDILEPFGDQNVTGITVDTMSAGQVTVLFA